MRHVLSPACAAILWTNLMVTGMVLAVPVPAPLVGHGTASLAMRPVRGSESWRIVDEGESLPPFCQLRAAGVGTRLITVEGLKLHLEAGAVVELVTSTETIGLLAGRISVNEESSRWSVIVNRREVPFPRNKHTIWNKSSSGLLEIVTIKAGSGALPTHKSKKPLLGWDLPAPCLHVSDLSFNLTHSAPLSPADVEQVLREFPARPRPQGLGQLVIEDAQNGVAQRLDVARYQVNVVLQPPVALVQIDQSFYNPHPRTLEGNFVFNLPPGAAVSRFAMDVKPNQLMEGELVERKRANQVYSTIVASQRDPAILEEIGDNLFRMRVFPIPASDAKRIVLDYTVPLEPLGGNYQFRLPLFSDRKPIWNFSVSGRLSGEAQIDSLRCPSHREVEIQHGAQEATWEWSAREFRPDADLLVTFQGKPETQPTVRAQRAEPLAPQTVDETGGTRAVRDPHSARITTYFLLTVPEAFVTEEAAALDSPADILLLIDTSRHAKNRARYVAFAKDILRHASREDRVRVAAVDVNHRWLHPDWVKGGSPDAEKAIHAVENQYAWGSAHPRRAVTEAVTEAFPEPPAERPAANSRRRVVIWLSEGTETLGEQEMPFGSKSPFAVAEGREGETTSDKLIASKLREVGANLTILGMSSIHKLGREAHQRLAELAEESSGQLFDSHSSLDQRELFRWVLSGLPSPRRITSLDVDGALAEDLMVPRLWRAGSPLRIYGRAHHVDQLTLRMKLDRNGRTQDFRHTLAVLRQDELFVGRSWAKQRVTRWHERQALGEKTTDAERTQLIALSREWSVLSPLTAFLVLETEDDYRRWAVDRADRRRYWKPTGTKTPDPLPPAWIAQALKDQKAVRFETRAAQLLASIQAEVAAERFGSAAARLAELSEVAVGDQRLEVHALRQQIDRGLARQAERQTLPREFPVLDLVRGVPRSSVPAANYVLPSPETNPDVSGSRFARRLAKSVPIEQVPRKSWRDFTDWIEVTTGVAVDFDQRELNREGFNAELPVRLVGFGSLPIDRCLKFAARFHDLHVVEEQDRLLLTSTDRLEQKRTTEVYPLEDLLLSEGSATVQQLRLSTGAARQQAAAARIRAKLREPVHIDLLADTKLVDAAEHFADKLGLPVLIDERSLEQEQLNADTHLARWRARGISASDALRRVLSESDQNLEYAVAQEAIVITTRQAAKTDFGEVRLYPARDLVEWDLVRPRQFLDMTQGRAIQRSGWWPNGIWPRGTSASEWNWQSGGMMGGMMGGGMGGMGGMAAGGRAQPVPGGPALPIDGANGDAPAASHDQGANGLAAGNALSSGGDDTRTGSQWELPAFSPHGRASEVPIRAGAAESKPPTVAPSPWPLMQLVTETIGTPEPGWADDGGDGRIEYFDPTFDLLVRTNEETHEQLESLFERLRKLPKRGVPATQTTSPALRIGREQLHLIGWESLVNTITEVVTPYHPGWVDNGGANALQADPSRLALVVQATQTSHEELHTLLTLLRRSRYAAKFNARPWQLDAIQLFDAPNAALRSVPQPAATKANPEDLQRLSVRKVPPRLRATWSRRELDRRPDQLQVSVDAATRRVEFSGNQRVIRYDAQAAATEFTDLDAVVLDRDVDAARRQIDELLPWWPHRSNEELAAAFRVASVPQESTEDDVVLRLTPRQAAESSATYFQATFEAATGHLVRLDLIFDGKLVGLLRAVKPEAGAERGAESFVLHDAAGHPLVEWQLVQPAPAAAPLVAVDEGWEKLLTLDRRDARPQRDPEYFGLAMAFAQGDWGAAYGRLQTELGRRPNAPLLRLLRGVCVLNDASLAPRAQAVADLQEAVASPATGIALLVATHPSFEQRLTPKELAEILARQPEERQSLEVCLQLGRLALAAEDPLTALTHARRAWTLAAELFGTSEPSDMMVARRFLLRTLLASGRTDEARQRADDYLATQRATLDSFLAITDLLHEARASQHSLALVEKALESEKFGEDARYRLTRRAADFAEGAQRAGWLWKAIALAGPNASGRGAELELLAESLTTLDDAEAFLKQSVDKDVRGRIMFRRAQLTDNIPRAAALYEEALAEAPIPVGQEATVLGRWFAAGLHTTSVDWCESQLRQGRVLDAELVKRLAASLRKLDRLREAERFGR